MEQGSSGWRSSMYDWGISSIAPFCRREESSCCRTEAMEALFTTVSWTPSNRGDFSQTEVCSRTELCGEPKEIPPVDAPIREWNAIEEAECRAKEDIPEMGCREGLEAETPSTTKESPRRPCLGWWRVKCWTDRWPAQGPYAAGENRLCPLTHGPLAAKGRTVEGERRTRPPTARPRKNEGELVLHTKTRGVVVTDLSEESAFEAGRYAFAVWSCLLAVKRLSSFRPEGQERLGGARSGRPVGPLQVNPSAWSLVRDGPATGSPNRSWGRVRSLGATPARRLLSG